MFDSIDEIINIDSTALIAGATYIKFNVDLDFRTNEHTLHPIIASITIDSNAELVVGLGMLDLVSTADMEFDAYFELSSCDPTSEICPGELVTTDPNAAETFYVEGYGNYSMGGDLSLLPDFDLGGFTAPSAAFSISDENIFDPDPEYEFSGLTLKIFCTSRLPTLLHS